MSKTNWLEVMAGVGLASLTILDVVPGDEVAGVPIGLALVFDGFGWLR